MKYLNYVVSIIFIIFLLNGCSNNNPSSPNSDSGSIRMYLVDAPANFDAVNIVVSKVEVNKSSDTSSTSGWTVINSQEKTYNLLDLQNGANAVLGDTTLSAGHYSQIRLIIGSGSNIVMNGIKHDLVIPSGSQTGIKLIHSFDISANTLYQLTLDFNVDKSIVVTGSGKIMLKPTIRVVPTVTSGTISGTVLPLQANATAWTMVNSDTVKVFPDSTGYFKFMAIPEDSYNVHFTANNTTYNDTTISNVKVTAGTNTNLGTINLVHH